MTEFSNTLPVSSPKLPLSFNSVEPIRCGYWLKEGLRMFMAYPRPWALMAIVSFCMLFVAGAMFGPIPIFGPMLAPVLLVLLVAGMLYAAQTQAQGQAPRFGMLWEGARTHLGNLVLLGVFFSLPLILISLLSLLVMGGGLMFGAILSLFGSTMHGWMTAMGTVLGAVFTTGIAFLVVWSAMLLALWFAPALIMYGDANPLEALKLSWRASMHNLGAMVLLFVVLYVLGAIAMFPAGLGMIVLIPVIVGSLHAAYRDIFVTKVVV